MNRLLLSIFAACLCLGLTAASASAATLWDESVSGDLSDNQAAPNTFALSVGDNSIIGTVGGTNTKDFVALTVPAGDTLSAITLVAYVSNDSQGFTGVQAGSSFVGNPETATPYLGYVHFGTNATNGALPPTNLIGADLLPLMGNTALAVGAGGFTPPLSAGTYTFLIQQLGASTAYQFDYKVSAVPEPATTSLCVLGAAAFCAHAWSKRRKAC